MRPARMKVPLASNEPRARLGLILAMLAISNVAACDSELAQPIQSTSPQPHERATPSGFDPVTIDDEFTNIAREEIPGFGGMYLENGAQVILLTDLSQSAAAIAHARLFRALGEREFAVEVRLVEYDFPQLVTWKDQLRASARALITFIDADERENAVTVEAATEEDIRLVELIAKELNIPDRALRTSLGGAIQFDATLSDAFSPIPGAVKFGSLVSECSAGVPAEFVFGGEYGIITASHCSEYEWGWDGGEWYQPSWTTHPIDVGYEYVDPDPQNGERNSDVSFVRLYSVFDYQIGRMARTYLSSTTIDPAYPVWSINAALPYAYDGDSVNITGYATGWRYGRITHTCADAVGYRADGTGPVWFLCQETANYPSGAGDSGAPIFTGSSALSKSRATFVGIHSGRRQSGSTTEAVLSPLENIEADLGDLYVCDPELTKWTDC